MSATEPPAQDARILTTWRESPLPVKALLAGIFVNRLGAFIQVFLVLFMTTRGFSTVQAGIALGGYAAGAVFGVLIGGTLTDRLGPRRTILVSMAGTAGFTLAILYLDNFALLLATVVAVGAINAAYRPAAKLLISELTLKSRQVMIFAMLRLASNLGGTAAPLIGTALVAVSYDLLFWGEAAAALGYAVIAAIALPRRGTGAAGAPDADAAGGTVDAGAAKDTAEEAPDRGYLSVLADRRFTVFLFALLVNAAVYVQYLGTLPVAMTAAGLGPTWFGAMVALNGVIVISCELLITKVVQRMPMRIIVVVGFVLLGGGLACYALPFGAAVFVVGTLVWSLAEIIAGPTMFAYPAMAGPEHLRGRYLGAASAMFSIGGAIGPALGLALWNLVGTDVWLWCAAACAIGVAAGWYGMRPPDAARTTGDAGDGPSQDPATTGEPGAVEASVTAVAPAPVAT
ncbi:MAG TPA: MFS transporter, partial [Pseudonocardiaceae bacterium]